MFRNIATIGLICLSAGSFAAEKAPNPNKVENATIKKALVNLLNERSAWGSSPTQSTAASTAATNRLALENYLSVRDSWGGDPGAAPSNSNARALSVYLARRDSWGSAPAAKSNTIATALSRFLSDRASWGTDPVISSAETNMPQSATALADYLERRASWNKAAATRVAAFTMTRPAPTDALACTGAIGQITGSGSINFAFGSAGLTNESSGRLEQVAATARDCAGFRIRIEGHTDAAGDAAMNQALSEARAAAVADYLQAAGIDSAALEAIGFGESQPLVPNTSRANRAQNRRIELTVLTN